MKYNQGEGLDQDWIVAEDCYIPNRLGKSEVVEALGNGYMGLRSATEEIYRGEIRNTFVAGTFNHFDESEVTELPNAADLIQIDIVLNGELLDLTKGSIQNYVKQLNLRTGELKRQLIWILPSGESYELTFKRFVSLKQLHLLGQRIEIRPLNASVKIQLSSGINGQMTNSGVQHFIEGEKRFYDKKYIQLVQTTTQSKINFVLNTVHRFEIEGNAIEPDVLIRMDRRKILCDYSLDLNPGLTLTIEKLSNIYTSRDQDHGCSQLSELKLFSYKELEREAKRGYQALFEASAQVWHEKVWALHDVHINGKSGFEQLAIRFSIYHIFIMTPAHDHRMSIAAKGLTGEGYKGHTFWDTEIFVLPFWIYSSPNIARSLLEYRYLSLPGAHKKAAENGYQGAMFPWESAWLDDGEVTPVWGAADIVTGQSTKIWSGFIEQHITSDVSFAAWQYYQITGDDDFMNQFGYELFMDTAIFWSSRLEWQETAGQYHICDVVGPDEYKEHVNNNAFVNYMAHWTIKNAIYYYEFLKAHRPEVFAELNQKFKLEPAYERWLEQLNLIYLPSPGADLVIPQDDTYLKKEIIDLTKYKNQENVGLVFNDYNLERINEIQVSKQADIMLLLYLMENLFDVGVKRANWNYYEPKTLHDSSLSLSTHCILANDLGDEALAHELFIKTAQIDLGPNMKTSDHGIHAAALGGLWQCVVNGFGGIRMLDGKLRIEPRLPKAWEELSFNIHWKGQLLSIHINHTQLQVQKVKKDNVPVCFYHQNQEYELNDVLLIPLNL